MKARSLLVCVVAAAVPLPFFACGGIAHRHVGPEDAGPPDAGSDAGPVRSYANCPKPPPPADSFQPNGCTRDADCRPGATCQDGVCCAGALESGQCTCGGDPECNAGQVCCRPFGKKVQCVDDIALCGAL